MDVVGSGSWPVAGFGVVGIAPAGSATSELVRFNLNIPTTFIQNSVKMWNTSFVTESYVFLKSTNS